LKRILISPSPRITVIAAFNVQDLAEPHCFRIGELDPQQFLAPLAFVQRFAEEYRCYRLALAAMLFTRNCWAGTRLVLDDADFLGAARATARLGQFSGLIANRLSFRWESGAPSCPRDLH
jgi:hypothetical protein